MLFIHLQDLQRDMQLLMNSKQFMGKLIQEKWLLLYYKQQTYSGA